MPGEGGTDWVAWHTDYVDPSSDLSWRRRAVQSAVRCSLDEAGPEPFRIVSACSGDGRDLLEVLATHAAAARTQVRLLELDDRLARRAEDVARDHGLEGVEVVRSDAGRTDSYAGAVPADLVLLCGVFGNLSDEDVQATVGPASRRSRSTPLRTAATASGCIGSLGNRSSWCRGIVSSPSRADRLAPGCHPDHEIRFPHPAVGGRLRLMQNPIMIS